MIKRYHRYIASVILVILSITLQAQVNQGNPDSPNDIHQLINQKYRADDILIHGRIYYSSSSLILGNPFLFDETWVQGSVYIHGTSYVNLKLNYNIVTDELILNTEGFIDQSKIIVLIPAVVDSFTIENKHFVNKRHLKQHDINNNFVEVIFRGKFLFLRKYWKIHKKEFSQSAPNGIYTDTSEKSYILYKQELHPVNSRKKILAFFSSNKKEIKRYLRVSSIKYRKADKKELLLLLNYCNEIL